ncbi:hypothetical protein EC988_008558 [Linderina pennispora]|nr:hypothetical protein EC988_008558 [Linderina pennispora]
MLPKLRNVPRYVFLENVMNFENSRSRTRLVETLGTLGFEVNECLVSPVQMGVPNNRLRYFLIAQRRWAADDAENAARTTKYLARGADAVHKDWPFGPAVESIDGVSAIPLSSYIDASLDAVESLRVPQSAILKRQRLEFDIVRASSAQTSTFTKSYGSRNLIGSGSLLQTRNLDVVENGFGAPERLLDLGIRFFSPKEVALLHHFPYRAPDSPVADGRHYLEFPASLTQRQQLQLLGNSLNVKVVAELIRHILFA